MGRIQLDGVLEVVVDWIRIKLLDFQVVDRTLEVLRNTKHGVDRFRIPALFSGDAGEVVLTPRSLLVKAVASKSLDTESDRPVRLLH